MSSITVLLLLFSWSLCGIAGLKFYKPGLLSNTTCDPEVQRKAIPFRPRCFGAKFYYSLIQTTIAKGQDCGALNIDPKTAKLAIHVGPTSDADYFRTGGFMKKAQKWTPDPSTSRILADKESTSGTNATIFLFNKPRTSGVGRPLFDVRYMHDSRPIPDRCGALTLVYQINNLQFMSPNGINLDLPSCENPPKNTGIRSIQQITETAQLGVTERCHPTIKIEFFVSTPVVATRPSTSSDAEKMNICISSNRMFHDNTCDFRDENMAEVFDTILSDGGTLENLASLANATNAGFRIADENGDDLRNENSLPKEPPVGPKDYRCQATQYWYGVVSAQILCPEECEMAGTASQCPKDILDDLCGNKTCEPTVLVTPASNDDVAIPVPWHLTDSGTGETYEYYRTYSQVHGDDASQFVYQVIDSNLANEGDCANLQIGILDRKDELSRKSGANPVVDQPRYGPMTSNMSSTLLPLPFWSATAVSDGMSSFFPFSETYDTDLKCGLDYVQIKVNFILAYVNVTDRDGLMVCVTNRNYGCEKSEYRKNVWNWNAKEETRKFLKEPQGLKKIRHANHKDEVRKAKSIISARGFMNEDFIWQRRVRSFAEVPRFDIS